MTSRPGNRALAYLRYTRGKALCHLVRVDRTDGVVLAFTDWDRNITVGQLTFLTAKTVGLSAERREGGMRSGDQEFYGVIDGQHVRIHDLAGYRYRGAVVTQSIVDARFPWIEVSRTVKVVTDVKFTETGWTATMQMLSQTLERPKGGRFNGVNSPNCLYRLGGPFCKKDISGFTTAGVRVTSVVTPNVSFLTHADSWRASYADDFFREGVIQWLWAPPSASGTITSAITGGATATVTDSTKSWTVNEHVGRSARVLRNAAGVTSPNGFAQEYKLIVSNTATTLTLAGPWSNSYGVGQHYDVAGPSDKAGTSSPIIYYADGTRRLDLFFPTPRPIVVGDSGIVEPGCDGLPGTCKGKYDNLENHGGIDARAPTASDIIKTPEDN